MPSNNEMTTGLGAWRLYSIFQGSRSLFTFSNKLKKILSQPEFTCLKSEVELPEQCVKSLQKKD